MAYSLKKGDKSNYEVVITFSEWDKAHEESHVLQHLAASVNLPGFRKGHVPMDIVKQQFTPETLNLEIEEHIINHEIKNMLKEHEEIKFIGEPYGYKKDDKKDPITITLYIDVYPEVEVKNDSWKKEKIDAVETKVEKKEVEDAYLTLRKNYANYEEAETLELDTISKISMEFLDKEGKVIDKGTTYLGEPEFNEDNFWKDTFLGKKKGEVIELDYKEKKLPQVLLSKSEDKPTKVRLTIKDIKKQILPDFTPETIAKLFGKDAGVKNEEDLKNHIEKTLKEQKYMNELVHNIEHYITTLREKFFSVIIPQTMINEEFKSRLASLEQRFGSKEKVQEYLKSLKEEDATKFITDIQNAAAESLEKFFILTEVAQLLNIDIDRNSKEELAVEKKLYEYFNPSDTANTEEKKATKRTKKTTDEGKEEKSEWKEEKKTVKRTRKTTKKDEE